MKNLFLILLTQFMILSFCNGQEPSDHFANQNALKINPFGFANSTFQISYERFIGERKSSFLIAPSIIIKETNNESITGWELTGQYRIFLTHNRKDQQKTFLGVHNYGFYTGLYGTFFIYNEDYILNYWDETANDQKSVEASKEVDAIEGGVLLGVQVDITPRILIDFYVGGGIRNSDVMDSFLDDNPPDDYYVAPYGVFDHEYKGVKPILGLSLGITF